MIFIFVNDKINCFVFCENLEKQPQNKNGFY